MPCFAQAGLSVSTAIARVVLGSVKVAAKCFVRLRNRRKPIIYVDYVLKLLDLRMIGKVVVPTYLAVQIILAMRFGFILINNSLNLTNVFLRFLIKEFISKSSSVIISGLIGL
jgi:hypothetical protein